MQKGLTIRIPAELKESFDKICKENAVNVSALLRNWIQKYVDENTKEMDGTKLDDLQLDLEENVFLSESKGMFYADVVEENGDEHRLAQANNIEDLHEQLKNFGQLK